MTTKSKQFDVTELRDKLRSETKYDVASDNHNRLLGRQNELRKLSERPVRRAGTDRRPETLAEDVYDPSVSDSLMPATQNRDWQSQHEAQKCYAECRQIEYALTQQKAVLDRLGGSVKRGIASEFAPEYRRRLKEVERVAAELKDAVASLAFIHDQLEYEGALIDPVPWFDGQNWIGLVMDHPSLFDRK